MTLIVCPAEGWDSLVSVEDATRYMHDFGYEQWPIPDPEPPEPDPVAWRKAEVALRKATQFIIGRYSIKAENLDPVHKKVQAACCEAAIRALDGDLVADSDGRIVTEETVDVLTTKYAAGAQNGAMAYPVIDALMKHMTDGGDSLTIKMIRG